MHVVTYHVKYHVIYHLVFTCFVTYYSCLTQYKIILCNLPVSQFMILFYIMSYNVLYKVLHSNILLITCYAMEIS
jgi:hypothetical protein